MFPRNALIYRFTQPATFNRDQLAEDLASKLHREPAAQELATYGFIPPFDLGEESPLVQTVAGVRYVADLIAAKKTERILPGAVVRDALKKKVDSIEAEQMRKVYKKERDQLKDEIVQALLPQAFLRHKVTYAMIFDDMIVVDATSGAQAEDLLSTLREAIGSLPCRPVMVKNDIGVRLTDCVRNKEFVSCLGDDKSFSPLDECAMANEEDGSKAKVKAEGLPFDQLERHLKAGMFVTQLALDWQGKLSFLLDDQLRITRLRFEDLLQDQAAQDGGDDAAGQLVASLAIAAGTMAQFVPALIEALGGEDVPQGI